MAQRQAKDKDASRVVVTGIGLVTSIGRGRTAWEALLAGRSGISPVSSFDTAAYSVHRGGEIADFPRPGEQSDGEHGRATQLAIAATRYALADGEIEVAAVDPIRAGVCMGTTSGEPQEVERLNDALRAGVATDIGARFGTHYPCHVLATNVAREVGFAGEVLVIPTACAAGNYAIAYASDALRSGRQDVMLAGGADAFSRITFSGFARLGAIAPELCRPFDRDREGMIPGEGAAMLLLERFDHARARGARIYAEVAGYGLSCDAFHMTGAHPEGDGAVAAMRKALADAGLAPEDVDYISAHGTGTERNDLIESRAVKVVFGEHAGRIPISSIKSMLGHTMGAASAIEAAVCALALAEGRIPPTINHANIDPECDLDVVPNVARTLPIEVAMSNAYAFGGNNSALVMRRVLDGGT